MNRCKLSWKANFSKIVNPLCHLLWDKYVTIVRLLYVLIHYKSEQLSVSRLHTLLMITKYSTLRYGFQKKSSVFSLLLKNFLGRSKLLIFQ